jgi:hypothetical protein
MVLARNDLATAANRIRAAIGRHGAGHAPLTSLGLESLLEVLEGQLPGQASLLSWVEENDAYVDQLTRHQAKVARILREQRRLKVIGGAGTGKTWLALEHARHLAAAGERVALVCYSRGLARFLQRMTAEWPPAHRPAYVGLFHALPLAWGADPPPEDPAEQPAYYDVRLPAQLGELAATLGEEERYDAIIVDEAQNVSAAWWPPTLACLRDQRTGRLYAFSDEAQRVFERHGEVPIPLPPIVQDENIRNTRQIAQVFGSLGAGLARYRGMDGPPVRFVPCRVRQTPRFTRPIPRWTGFSARLGTGTDRAARDRHTAPAAKGDSRLPRLGRILGFILRQRRRVLRPCPGLQRARAAGRGSCRQRPARPGPRPRVPLRGRGAAWSCAATSTRSPQSAGQVYADDS